MSNATTATTSVPAATPTSAPGGISVGGIALIVVALVMAIVAWRIVTRQRAAHAEPPRDRAPVPAPAPRAAVPPAPLADEVAPVDVPRPAAAPVAVAQPAAEPVDAAPPPPPAAPIPAAPAPAPLADDVAPVDAADDLTRLKGVGPKLAATLSALGYTRFAQIAALGPAEAEALDAQLGSFRGRLARDRWIEQAAFLAKGDIDGFEAAFGKL